MQIRDLCKFEPAGQTAYCIGFLAMYYVFVLRAFVLKYLD
jgi:hypothetical protein